MQIFVAHGLNTDGQQNTQRLARALRERGHAVTSYRYAEVNPVTASLPYKQREIGRALRNLVRPGDVFIGHSWAAVVLHQATMAAGFPRLSRVFLFSAALDSDAMWPCEAFDRLINIYNPYDKALWWARLMFWNDIGDLGRAGYQGPPDSRIEDHHAPNRTGRWYHSAVWFDPPHLESWVRFIEERLP